MGPNPVRTPAKRQRNEDDDSYDPAMTTATGKQRVRVSRACNECRKRKDRCDGCRPACENCFRLGRSCSYRPSKKRGLRTGYVRAIETLLGLIFMTVEGTEQWLCSLLDGKETANSAFHLQKPAGDSIELLLDAWRQSQVVKHVEQLLSPIETNEEDEEDDVETTSLFDRRTLDAISLISKALSAQNVAADDYPTYQQPSPMNTEQSSITIQQSQLGNASCITTLSTPLPLMTPIPTGEIFHSASSVCSSPHVDHRLTEPQPGQNPTLPSNWKQMLDLYFFHTHCWFPVAPKHDLLRTAYTLESGIEPASTLSQDELAFLMAVLTFASSQPLIVESQTRVQSISERAQSEFLFATTMRLLPSNPDAHELGHIRALLVLCLVHIRDKQKNAAWLTIGRAVYASTSLKGTPFKKPKPATSVADGVKRTMLCCVALDSLVAIWIHARPYFQRSDITDIEMLLTEGIEEWETLSTQTIVQTILPSQQQPARTLSTFNNFMELIGSLNDFLRLSTDVDANQLRRFSQNIQDQIQLPPLFASGPNTPVHNLNIRLLSTSIISLVSSKLIYMVGMEAYPEFPKTDQLRGLCEIVEHYYYSLGILAVPPTFHIYIDTICRSLELLIHLSVNSEDGGHDFHTLQRRFANLNSLTPKTNRGQTEYQSNKGLPSNTPHTESRAGSFREHNIGLPIGHVINTSITQNNPEISVQNNGSFAPSSEIHPPLASFLQSPQSDNATSQMSPQARQGHSDINQQVYPNSLIGFVPSDIDDDGLFQSLMDLDATDWSANSPNFMRHLGAPSDLSANLNFFISPDQR